MKKRITTVLIAIVLAVLMTVISPIQTLAASRKLYISEIRISDSIDTLKNLGYKVLEKDLNAGGNDGFSYIGYKTTTDPDEAITDISIMDMKGGYSFGDYEEMLKNQKKAVSEQVSTYRIAINEFTEKYNAGSKAALVAFESLNNYIEDDSGKLIGDMLIDPALSDEDLIKLFMQGTIIINAAIADCLAIGLSQDDEKSWLSRIADNEQNAPETYDDAIILIDVIGDVRDTMKPYVDSGLTIDDSVMSPELFDNFSSDEISEFGKGGFLYEILDKFKYKDRTVADWFMADNLSPADVYPIIAALTPGQLAIAKICGIQSLIKASVISNDLWDEAKEFSEETITEAFGEAGIEKVSVYTGIDRDMYNGGVALTSEAKRKSAATGDSDWWHGNISHTGEILMYSATGVAAAMVAVGYGVANYYAFETTFAVSAQIVKTINSMDTFLGVPLKYATPEVISKYGYIQTNNIVFMERQAAAYTFTGRMAIIGQTVFWISVAILCVMVGLYFGLELYNYYNPEYTEIPLILMDLKFGEDDDIGDWEKYIKYNVVLNEKGEAGDLNCFTGKQWNAMYVTKNKFAGAPIEADSFTVQYGDSTTPRNCSPVHYFGSIDAFNLNSHCYNDDVDGIFMFFIRDDNAFGTEAASVFGPGALAVVAGLGGLIIGAFGAILFSRKKKTTAAEA